MQVLKKIITGINLIITKQIPISLVLRVAKCNTHDSVNIDCKEKIIALLLVAQPVFHGFKINESIRFFFEKQNINSNTIFQLFLNIVTFH